MKTFFKIKIYLLVICSLVISGVSYAQSTTLLMEEDFDFAIGSNVVGQNGWVLGTAGTNSVTVSEEGLTYPDYSNTAGKAASFVPLSDRIQKTFEGTQIGSYYYSFLINVSSAGSGEFFAGLFSANAFRGRVYLKEDGAGFQFGLVKTTTGTVTYTSGTPFSFGTTYLVVVKYDFIAGNGNDQVSLFINPDLTAKSPGDPDIGPLADAGNDVSANVFAIQGRNNSGNFMLDGLRIATTWDAIRGAVSVNHFLELPKFISSDMVLQRDTPLKLWGWGVPGDIIEVELTRESNVVKNLVEVDEDGRWLIELPAQSATTEPCQLAFSLKDYPEIVQEFDNILIGDVWFAGGQSNMEKKVNHLLEADEYTRDADNFLNIRAFRASYNALTEPSDRVNAASSAWIVCNSAQVADNVSAVAYVFAKEIYEKTGVPIGIMQAYRGGTELETWLSPYKLAEPEYCAIAGRNDFLDSSNANNAHSVNFNGQINPLAGFPLKGFIWYQGESNTKRADEYHYMMRMLIEDWRSLWNQGDLPFYYVQMFNVLAPAVYEEGNWADLREQQSFLLHDVTVNNVGMAVIIDTNEEATNSNDNIRMHPRTKKPVGERLANIALRDTYGYDILAEGPIVNRYKFSNDSVYLYFRNYGEGLKMKTGDSELKGFVVSGADKKFKSATATLFNDSTIAVKSTLVQDPIAVRYAWARNPICNLYNSADIPATPFRTDMWKLTSYAKPQSSCVTKNSNNDLVAILVNGTPLPEFQKERDSYDVFIDGSNDKVNVQVITDSPFSEVSILEDEREGKITIYVTAENTSVKTYKLTLNKNTGIDQNKERGWVLYNRDQGVVFLNKLEQPISIKLYDLSGSYLSQETLNSYEEKFYTYQKGVYFFQLSHDVETQTIKYIIR